MHGFSQSQHSSWSRDHHHCRVEVVELTRCIVVAVVCAGSSMFTLLPVAVVGGPSQAGVALSRLVLPCLPATTLPSSGSTDPGRDVDDQRSSADMQRQNVEFELRQLLEIRQLLSGAIHKHFIYQSIKKINQ